MLNNDLIYEISTWLTKDDLYKWLSCCRQNYELIDVFFSNTIVNIDQLSDYYKPLLKKLKKIEASNERSLKKLLKCENQIEEIYFNAAGYNYQILYMQDLPDSVKTVNFVDNLTKEIVDTGMCSYGNSFVVGCSDLPEEAGCPVPSYPIIPCRPMSPDFRIPVQTTPKFTDEVIDIMEESDIEENDELDKKIFDWKPPTFPNKEINYESDSSNDSCFNKFYDPPTNYDSDTVSIDSAEYYKNKCPPGCSLNPSFYNKFVCQDPISDSFCHKNPDVKFDPVLFNPTSQCPYCPSNEDLKKKDINNPNKNIYRLDQIPKDVSEMQKYRVFTQQVDSFSESSQKNEKINKIQVEELYISAHQISLFKKLPKSLIVIHLVSEMSLEDTFNSVKDMLPKGIKIYLHCADGQLSIENTQLLPDTTSVPGVRYHAF